MQINWSNYPLASLHKHAIKQYRQGGGTRPDVVLIEIEGQQFVLKNHNACDRLFAFFIGPLLAWRECKALKKLHTIDGIPNLIHRPDKRSFIMSHHPSEQLTKLSQIKPDWPVFFNHLQNLIHDIHSQGVAHNDLRNPTNILITKQGKPVLVDLVACYCKGANWNKINHWIFQRFCQVDLSAITKAKQKVAPQLIQENDIHAHHIAGNTGLFIRKIGQAIRHISKRLFTSK